MSLLGKPVINEISIGPNPVNVGNQILVRVKADIIPTWFTYNVAGLGYNQSNWQRNYIEVEGGDGIATKGRIIGKDNTRKY